MVEIHRQHFLLIWKHREESVEKFVNKLNSFHLPIEFTAEYSKETIHKIGRREFIKSNFFLLNLPIQYLGPSFLHTLSLQKMNII